MLPGVGRAGMACVLEAGAEATALPRAAGAASPGSPSRSDSSSSELSMKKNNQMAKSGLVTNSILFC